MPVEKVDRDNMRQMIIEMRGGSLSPQDHLALESCTAYASHLWVGYIGEKPACAWGLIPPTLLSDHAYLWLYTTPEIDIHKFTFIRTSQIVMEHMKSLYPAIYGVTDIHNTRAVRWLKWLGAKFYEPDGSRMKFIIGEFNG